MGFFLMMLEEVAFKFNDFARLNVCGLHHQGFVIILCDRPGCCLSTR